MTVRKLEIGCGNRPRKGFEHLDIRPGKHIEHLCDAAEKLPFEDGTFDYVFASHVLEHLPWWDGGRILKEWARIVKSGGELDVSVPNGVRLCLALLLAEDGAGPPDGWRLRNPEGCPYRWANGMIYFGGKLGGFPDFHKAIYTPKYLRQLMEQAGLVDIRTDPRSPIPHKEINLRMRGRKP